jgi:hypothetical protein
MKKINDFLGRVFLPIVLTAVACLIAYQVASVLTNK